MAEDNSLCYSWAPILPFPSGMLKGPNMQRGDFKTVEELGQHISGLERTYTERLFYALYKNAGNLQTWYNEANKVPDAWVGKMAPSEKESTAPWEQVGEIVISGLIYREFLNWFPIGLPIGSEARLASHDAIVQIDVKTHKEGDSDLDRTQDVRPEQISTDENDTHVMDGTGQLGDSPPKLPPYYVFGPRLMKVTISAFAVCVYEFKEAEKFQYLTRVQLFTVPNGILRSIVNYRDIFQAGKDGRTGHRYRVNLPALAGHEAWRWREIRYREHGFEVTR